VRRAVLACGTLSSGVAASVSAGCGIGSAGSPRPPSALWRRLAVAQAYLSAAAPVPANGPSTVPVAYPCALPPSCRSNDSYYTPSKRSATALPTRLQYPRRVCCGVCCHQIHAGKPRKVNGHVKSGVAEKFLQRFQPTPVAKVLHATAMPPFVRVAVDAGTLGSAPRNRG
jgi:hypothetical protein